MTDINEILEAAVPDCAFSAVGVAYWKTTGTRLSSLVAWAFLGSLASMESRAGILAISGSTLYVVDVDKIVGEEVSLADLSSAQGDRTVRQYPLAELRVTCDDLEKGCVLTIGGSASLKATFPSSYSIDNVQQAKRIEDAILSANTK